MHSPRLRAYTAHLASAALLGIAAFAKLATAQPANASYDIILRGGTVVDGTGAPRAPCVNEIAQRRRYGARAECAQVQDGAQGRLLLRGAIFPASDVADWADGRQPEAGSTDDGVTALCPRCGAEAVQSDAVWYAV